jgi:hypothetical protein
MVEEYFLQWNGAALIHHKGSSVPTAGLLSSSPMRQAQGRLLGAYGLYASAVATGRLAYKTLLLPRFERPRPVILNRSEPWWWIWGG